jgi:hypothetical protein
MSGTYFVLISCKILNCSKSSLTGMFINGTVCFIVHTNKETPDTLFKLPVLAVMVVACGVSELWAKCVQNNVTAYGLETKV